MAISTPMVNAPFLSIQGMRLGWTSGTVITVAAGRARNSSNLNDIIIESAITINAATQGAGGLDIGTLANSTFYAVYAIGSSYSKATPSALISDDLTQPLLPADYDMYRRIGYVLTSGAGAILEFRQVGESVDRWMWYDVGIEELNAGAQAAYTAVNIATSVPATATAVMFDVVLTPTAAADAVHLQPTGATGADGYAILTGAVAGVVQRAPLIVPCNATPSIDYKVTGTVTLNTKAYLDQLAA
jgi:hypothetical protein